jgi:histidinol-phosphate aminotransferase
MNIENLVRPNIRQLKSYQSARQIYDLSAGKTVKNELQRSVLLDANENSCGSPVLFDGVELNRYPDPYQNRVREKISKISNVEVQSVFVGSGSDEIIDLLIRIFCEPAVDSVLLPEPTYGMYRVSANIHNVSVLSGMLDDDFQLDVDDLIQRKTANTKIIFCCSPNNPTGNLLKSEDILKLCASVNAIVVVDEAYVEFAGGGSVVEHCRYFPNLVVMRTFSKAWGMAGIRLGYSIAHPTVIKYLQRVKAPYNVNSVTAQIALNAFDEENKRTEIIERIRNERDSLIRNLKRLKIVKHVYPSDANFILVRVTDAGTIYQRLVECGIIVRDRSKEPKLDNCLRITVGTAEENDLLIRTLTEIDV